MCYRIYVILGLLIVALSLSAQKRTGTYVLRGLIVDEISREPLSEVSIQPETMGAGTISNQQGCFEIEVHKGARLYFSRLAYQGLDLLVPDSVLELEVRWVIPLRYVAFSLREVEVEEDRRPPLPYRSDVFAEKPNVGHLFVHPISYFYYFFSRREKNKRAMLEVIAQERLAQQYMHIVGREALAEITGLEGEALEHCIHYSNVHLELTAQDNEYTVRNKILTILSDYYRLNNEKICKE